MAHPQDAADTPDEFGVLSSGGGVSSLKSRFEQLSAGHVGGHSLPSSHHPHSRHFHFPPTGKGTWSARSEAAQVGEDGATSDEAGPSGTHTLPSRLGRHHGGTIHQSLHWHRPTTHATHHSSGGASDSALDPPPSVTADIFASPDELPGTRPSLTRTVTDGNPFSPDPSPHAEAVVSDSPFVPTGQVDLAGSDVGSTGSGEGRDGTRAPPPRPPKNFLVATRGQVTPVASSSRSVVSVAGRKPPPPPIPPSHRKGYSYPETGAIGSADAPESQATVSSIRSRFDIQPNAEASSSFRSNGPSTNARPLSFEARQSFLKGQPPSPQTRPALAVPPRSPALPAADLHSQLDDRSVELLTRNSPSPLPDSDASSVGSRGEAGSGRPVVPPRPPIRNEVFAATMPEVPTTSTTTSSAYGTCPPPLPSRVRGDPFEEASPPPSLSSMPLESSRSIGSLPPGKPPAHPASIGRSKLSPAVVGSAPPRLPVRKANPGSVSPSRSPRTLPPPLRTANTTRTTGAAPIAAPPVRVVNHADTQPPPLNLPPPQRHPHQAQSLPVPVPASSEPRASSIPSHIQPPPPMRTAGSDAKMPPRRAVRDDADSSSSSGDDDEPGIGHSSSSHSGSSSRGPLSKSAPSSLGTPRHRNTAIFADELPDGTHVNRRPPSFVPDCVASAKSPFQTFAVAGHTIVTGSHDKCKVYRVGGMAHSGEKVCVVAEHGPSRETRVTALAFRPPCPSPAEQQLGARIPDDRLPGEAEEEGRYVWCGTREGHVWELDTLEGCIVESRNNVHSGPVTHIVRVGDRMLSLDEGGKMSIWLPSKGPGTAYTGVHLTGQPHTQRISLDKSAYALVLGEQLWVCTGPASHETKHGTGKGPRIRIYNPFTDDRPFNATSKPVSMPPEMAIGVGPVSSGTIIPTKAELAYLGHESGHISIWSRATYTCIGVQRLGSHGVTALAGVVKYLWAGNRTGRISVFDVDTSPWRMLKMWPAHKEPVTSIVVDPRSIAKVGRLQVASAGMDWTVRLWDGLLAVDWLVHELEKREPEFCSYRRIRALVCTFNIDAASPPDLFGNVENMEFLQNVLRSVDSPDIIVFGFQELIDLESKKLTAKTMLLGKKRSQKDMGESVSHQYRAWYDKLLGTVRLAMPPDCPYTVVKAESMVGLFTCIFVKNSEHRHLRDVAISTVKTGLGGRYGNKGSIVARFVIDDTSFCFANCHLAAGQKHVRQRNSDVADILESPIVFQDLHTLSTAYVAGGDGSMILDHEICFLSGDLNYRIDQRREVVIQCVAENRLAPLLEQDQLLKELRNNPSFRLRAFAEAPITFAPTYKYDRGSSEWDGSEKKRIPAWCDRILWRARSEDRVECTQYRRWEPTISDHRPVSGVFDVRVKAVNAPFRANIERELLQHWTTIEAELLAGAFDYYSQLA